MTTLMLMFYGGGDEDNYRINSLIQRNLNPTTIQTMRFRRENCETKKKTGLFRVSRMNNVSEMALTLSILFSF